jgi:hypothetical protein
MNIVVLLRVSNSRVRYDKVIDHRLNRVTYAGKPGRLAEIVEPAHTVAVDLDHLQARDVPAELHEALANCDLLIARSEFDLLLAAELRETYNIPGPLVGDILPIRDKLVMRRRARERGIDQPDFWSIPQFLTRERSGEFVLKPRRDGSSNGITAGDYAATRERAQRVADPANWLVESFVPGNIYHVDGFLVEGELQLVQLSQYVNTCLSYSGGTPLGSAQVPTTDWAVNGTREVAAALGYRNGSFHAEFIMPRSGVVQFLEFGGRVGGASVLEATQLRTGMHLHECDLRMQLGYPIDWQPKPASADFFGWFVFPLSARDTARRLPDLTPFERNLYWYNKNEAAVAAHGNSYAVENSPLVGIVRGNHAEVQDVLLRIAGHVGS